MPPGLRTLPPRDRVHDGRPDPSLPPARTVLHLGAHKTATTFIQTVLAANSAALARRGTGLLLPGHLRNDPDLVFSSTLEGKEYEDQLDRTRTRLSALMTETRQRTPRIVLSEEGILGSSRVNLKTRSLYPDPGRRLAYLPRGLDTETTEICLALRSYASFFAANISTVARRGKLFAFRDLRAPLLALKRGWPDVIADIRSRFPHTRLTLWRYEDFSRYRGAILNHLADGPVEVASEGFVNRSLSARAMVELEAAADSRGYLPTGTAAARDVARAFPAGPENPAYSPWSPEDAATLRASYDAHWREIRETHPDACPWTAAT